MSSKKNWTRHRLQLLLLVGTCRRLFQTVCHSESSIRSHLMSSLQDRPIVMLCSYSRRGTWAMKFVRTGDVARVGSRGGRRSSSSSVFSQHLPARSCSSHDADSCYLPACRDLWLWHCRLCTNTLPPPASSTSMEDFIWSVSRIPQE